MNCVIQASKDVKNNTHLSSGTTSVAYAATQYVIDNVFNFNNKRVLVYGLGEIGKNACKNLLEYTENNNIHLINRTHEKAIDFAKEYNKLSVHPLKELNNQIHQADVLIVSTGAELPTITAQNISINKKILVLDLSLPENVHKEVKMYNEVTLVNVDELSKITDKTLAKRQSEIPKAQQIIRKHKTEFLGWLEQRKFTPAVMALKASLLNIQEDEINFHQKKIDGFNAAHAEQITSRIIQKITTQFVKHLKEETTSVDQSIEIVSKIFNTTP